MPVANDAEHLVTMITVMVLWIINDYEDEDLKGRCMEIVDNLNKLYDIVKVSGENK